MTSRFAIAPEAVPWKPSCAVQHHGDGGGALLAVGFEAEGLEELVELAEVADGRIDA